ncbi:MAG: polysaccharide biosynthesis protein PslG [Thermoleophilales bacterium]|nr:polysaccharide biosynthesis protein PslG [Thermoleophilales bacterium]
MLRRTFVTIAAAFVAASMAPAADAAPKRLIKAIWGDLRAPDGTSEFAQYRRLGVTLYQTQLRWDLIAPTKPADAENPADPAYLWPKPIDDAVAEAARNHTGVTMMIIGAPGWSNGNRPLQWAPRSPADLAHFATAAARRYPSVRHWMIWGEPSRTGAFMPLTPQKIGKPLTAKMQQAPRRYARLLDAAYGALKAERRSNLVIGGNTYSGGDIRAVNWVRYLRLPNGKPPRMDLYGHNPFCNRAPNLNNPPGVEETVDFSDLGRFQAVIDRYLARPRGKRTIRFFLSEWTVPTGPDTTFNFYVTKGTQARFIRQGFKVARAVDAYALGWVPLRDGPPVSGGRTVAGGLIQSDGVDKPGFAAFAAG